MSFVKSYGMSVGSAAVYEAVYALSQYANTQAALTPMISNGEVVEIGVGAVLAIAGWYGVKKGSAVIAAFSIPTSAFLIIDGVVNVLKRNLAAGTAYASVAQARRVRAVAPVRQIVPQPSLFSPLTSSSN